MTSNRKMLQALLKNNGATKVDTAENGLEAVHAAQANPLKYDIIFMDNLMPVMVRAVGHYGLRITYNTLNLYWYPVNSRIFLHNNNQCGLEAVRKLREEGYAKLVVGVTGNVLDDDVMEYLAAGADLVLGKPVKVDMLRMLIRHVKEHGNLSRPDMTLWEVRSSVGDRLAWKRR